MAFNTQEQNIIQWGLQNGKSKDEVKQAISNYRLGIIPKTQPTEITKPSTFERIKTGIQEKGAKVQEQIAGEGEFADKNALERGIGATATGFSALSGTLYNALPEVARNTLDTIGGGVGAGINYLTDKISNNPALQQFAMSEAGKDTERVARVLSDLGIISGEILGAEAVKAGKFVDNKIGQGIEKTTELAKQTGTLLKEQGQKIVPKSEDIMTKVARITPKEAQTFQKMTGKSTGEYLSQKGNFNAPEDIVKVEAETFAKTLADKEATLAKLQGNFKSGVVDDVLESLKQKAVETSSKNVKAPYLKQVDAWLEKAKTTGLTMEEINQAKKLFEREVKLGYSKLTDATKVKQATYLDDALREFQDETASSLGFTNIKDLSKQIQASKFIVDKLGNKIVSNDLLNGVSLTDYIILAGGEPASVGAFLTKKLFSSKNLQAKLAKTLYKGEVKSPVKSVYSPQATKATQTKSNIKNNIPKSSLKSTTKSSLKGKGVIPETNLINEAKKYKSAEEFVKAQGTPVYRGEGGSNVAQGKALLAEGKHFASDSKYPQGFGKVSENIIKPNVKVLDLGDSTFAEISKKLGIPERRYISPKELSTLAKENGYDVLKYNGEYKSTGKQFTHFVDLTGDSTITKSQLEEIWKKANKNVEIDPLINEAKKYKSAEEFATSNKHIFDRSGELVKVGDNVDFSYGGSEFKGKLVKVNNFDGSYETTSSKGKQFRNYSPEVTVEATENIYNKGGFLVHKKGDIFKVNAINLNEYKESYSPIKTKSQLTEIWKKANKK